MIDSGAPLFASVWPFSTSSVFFIVFDGVVGSLNDQNQQRTSLKSEKDVLYRARAREEVSSSAPT